MTSEVEKAKALVNENADTVVFVTPLLRAREIKMATGLRTLGWNVILLYRQTTPFHPDDYFDVAIKFDSDREAHAVAMQLNASIFHVFSGAIDPLTQLFCRQKPGRVILDLNDVFCPSLFNYLHERFAPTKECLELADALCCRDLQAKYAERCDGFTLPKHVLLFQEYSWKNGPADPKASKKTDPEDVHVVSVGTFTVKSQGMQDSSYTKLAQLLAEQKIHLHIYPHWFYRKAAGSVFNFDVSTDLVEYLEMEKTTPYVHVHDSLPLDELARELPQFDFGIISGGSPELGQELNFLKRNYMDACYSGRISDYLDARLPVLINREVSFNYWLLDRLGIAVDLGDVLKPGFRERLLAIKHDKGTAKRANDAADKMSLRRHAARLVTFYGTLLKEIPNQIAPQPRWLTALESVPVLGPQFKRYRLSQEREIRRLQFVIETPDPVATKRKKLLAKKVQVIEDAGTDQLREEIAALQGRIGQLRHEISIEKVPINDIAGLLNWPEITNDTQRVNGFGELVQMIATADLESDASSAWKLLNRKNFDQLLTDGFHNFKRTIAFNYFTFPVQTGDPQVASLEEKLPTEQIRLCRRLADSQPDEPNLPLANQADYRYFVLLLWAYTRRLDVDRILERVSEPKLGNPIVVPFEDQMASQDIANSALEYYSMKEGGAFDRCRTVLEIGGGYGRNAFVILNTRPGTRYFMVDIPPALYVAQRYLSSFFNDLRVFSARDFSDYEQVKEDIENSSIVFLLPHQLKLLPDKMFDLAINISSFGEMNREQIERYFAEIDRVTAGAFYTKQWKESSNPFDKMNLKEGDYPVNAEWRQVYSRTCAVQTQFFESLYVIKSGIDK
jgi:putative sugar O-methyltransferase